MTALTHVRLGAYYEVALAEPDDVATWREKARALLMADVPPDRVTWTEPGGNAGLFNQFDSLVTTADRRLPRPDPSDPQPRVSRAFLAIAKNAALHRSPERFALLYRLLWRLQRQPRLMDDEADRDVRHAADMARAVRRDSHKMHAFVRFRGVPDAAAPGGERMVAWFEPQHHILRANAGFFVRRFAAMHWSILTPEGSLHWDGETVREGPPASRAQAPDGDPAEVLWRKYYASIFNPARLKVGAMLKEMPRRYWKNLPEAALIPELIAGAQGREAAMVTRGGDMFEDAKRPGELDEIAREIQKCRRCEIGCNGTRAVMGEGPLAAALMIVGEQPGDTEEHESKPFVGPAGQLLRAHLADAGIDISTAYVTNAVKHFKFTPKETPRGGKRRLHQSPSAGEIDMCRWWVESERLLVRPKLVLVLGASAARSLVGRTVSVQKERGQPRPLEDGSELWITTHPSYLLRLDDAARATEERRFAADLAAVRQRLTELVG